MINYKKIISEKISTYINIEIEEIESYIEVPKDDTNGDYAFPCFRLAKSLKKSPQIIAKEIKENIDIEENTIEKVEVAGGYLNFYINSYSLAKEVLTQFAKDNEYGKSEIGKGKNIIVEYSSPNIAKPFHIGHLKNTIIGHCLYNVYKFLGYNTIGLNHLGDYGTQFAKLIEGYKRWGEEYDFSENPIDKMSDMYVRINNLCSEDEKVLEECRETFKKLEDGDEYCVELWNKFKDLSLEEFNKIYKLLNVHFDSMNGEAFYSDKMQEVIDILQKNEKLTESEGAIVVDLEDEGIKTPCIIQKSNGSSIYATRDLAAILYRTRTYDFDKCLYVVGIEQDLHFKQIFAVAKYLDLKEKYVNGLEHISYGLIRLPEGKMSSRKGNFIKANDLLDETIEKANEIMADREIDNKDEIAKQVAMGAIVFNNLCENRVQNQVFDLNKALNFQGETGPYIQYTYVRTQSVIEKIGQMPNLETVDVQVLTDEYSQKILKLIYNFQNTLIQVTEKNEPSILSKYLIELAKAYSSFYNENKIIVNDEKIQNTRVYLTYAVGEVLKTGAKLLGIEMPNKM